jgi:hypothetical protein
MRIVRTGAKSTVKDKRNTRVQAQRWSPFASCKSSYKIHNHNSTQQQIQPKHPTVDQQRTGAYTFYSSCVLLILNCDFKILRDYFIAYNQVFIVKILCTMWRFEFWRWKWLRHPEDGGIARKHIGVTYTITLLTYYMEHSPSWEVKTSYPTQVNFPHFTEPEGSSPYSQELATCPCPGPDWSSLYPTIQFFEDPF